MRFSLITVLLCSAFVAPLLLSAEAPKFALEVKHQQLELSLNAARIPLTTKWTGADAVALGSVQRVDGIAGVSAQLVTFTLPGAAHTSRALTVLLTKSAPSDAWTVQCEWIADKCEDDSGSKDELQTISADATGVITRRVHRLNVENISYELPCKCCTALQTRTMETQEDETLSWNATTKSFERRTFRKWYITQPGEGLTNVARKALGDPTRLSRLYTLNPDLRQATTLADGQKVLVEKL